MIKKYWKKLTIIILMIVSFLYLGNNWLQVTKYNVAIKGLPKGFSNYRILHLSDVHNKWFGDNQKRIMNKIHAEKPEVIVVTGDIVDRRRFNMKPSLVLMEELVKDYPVYYVSGNHEWWSGRYPELKEELEAIGVRVLSNEAIKLARNNDEITLIGMDDPASYYEEGSEAYEGYQILATKLLAIMENNEKNATILLTHRPEIFDLYADLGVDLSLAGHAHGGQVRLPFIGGLIAPNQGLFPDYEGGHYFKEESQLVVSRGLGNSIIPFRIFNRPEIVVIELMEE